MNTKSKQQPAPAGIIVVTKLAAGHTGGGGGAGKVNMQDFSFSNHAEGIVVATGITAGQTREHVLL